jgi:hypothetical protein
MGSARNLARMGEEERIEDFGEKTIRKDTTRKTYT